MKKTAVAFCIVVLASVFASADPPNGIYPKELEGITHQWQSRASIYRQPLDVGDTIFLGGVYHYGNVGIVIQMTEGCVWDGEQCGTPYPVEGYDVFLSWDNDAGCYLQMIETSPDEAEFDAVTMTSVDAGLLRIGVFDIRGNGKVYKYSKDYEVQFFELHRWWPELPPDIGPV